MGNYHGGPLAMPRALVSRSAAYHAYTDQQHALIKSRASSTLRGTEALLIRSNPGSAVPCTKPSRGGAPPKEKLTIPRRPLTATETYYANTQAHCTYHACLNQALTIRLIRVAHAHPLHPAELAFVSYGIVLVRVRVRVRSALFRSPCLPVGP